MMDTLAANLTLLLASAAVCLGVSWILPGRLRYVTILALLAALSSCVFLYDMMAGEQVAFLLLAWLFAFGTSVWLIASGARRGLLNRGPDSESYRTTLWTRLTCGVALLFVTAGPFGAPVTASLFVWRHLDAFEALALQTPQSARVVSQLGIFPSDSFEIIYDPSGGQDSAFWKSRSIEFKDARHLWGPWYSAVL